MSSSGIVSLYYRYLTHLKKRKKFVAPLQLTGRIEDYLVHEFIGYAYQESGGRLLGKSNLGGRDQQKYDIAFVKGVSPDSERIVALVEAKYLRNAHRTSSDDNARDETLTTLKDLGRQLHRFGGLKHGGIPVELLSRNKEVYGLVFASYSKPVKIEDKKEAFYKDVKRKAKGIGFRFLDYETPQLNSVYEDVKVPALGTIYRVSLRTGLWRSRQ